VNLVLDLGNTKHKLAIFDGNTLVALEITEQLLPEHLEQAFQNFSVTNAILCSVDHYDEVLATVLGENIPFIHLSHTTLLPITNAYTTPTTLGKDRLSAAVGANALFPGKNVLSIDAGTCLKYDFTDSQAVYHGGAISPGLNMRLRAMHNFTARLPLIVPTNLAEIPLNKLIGNDTNASMLSGALNGALFEVDGTISAYLEKYSDLVVVITGGDAAFFELHAKSRIFARPNLVLEGLNTILNYNIDN